MIIRNLPANYKSYKYLVVRNVEGDWWYFGAWSSFSYDALQQAYEIDGFVVPVDEVKPA